jgi:uncharacterized protein YraI
MRKFFWHCLRALACCAAICPAATSAQQQAQALVDINLRAGPAQEYPVVSVLHAGTVHGAVVSGRQAAAQVRAAMRGERR